MPTRLAQRPAKIGNAEVDVRMTAILRRSMALSISAIFAAVMQRFHVIAMQIASAGQHELG
jgi:hypothetical protein